MTSRQSFDKLGRRLNGKDIHLEEDDDLEDSISQSDSIINNLAPSILTIPKQQNLAPPQLTISTIPTNSIQDPTHLRPLLRTRSTDGVTDNSNGVSGAHGSGDDHFDGLGDAEQLGRASGSRRIAVGSEFILAEVPSPILTSPHQGLSGLSEKLTNLQSRASSAASSRKNSASGPVGLVGSSFGGTQHYDQDSRNQNDRRTGENSASSSTNDLLHSPATTAVALIAQASKTGSRFGRDSKEKLNRTSITQASTRRQSLSRDAILMDKSLSAGPTPGSNVSKNRKGSRQSDLIPSIDPSTASASRTETPNASGNSTPGLKTPSIRMKPNVLETSHLHLQTHTPSGRRMINQYVIEDELGRGVHGKVRLARDTETGEKVAVKIVEREGKKKLGQNSNMWANRMTNKAVIPSISSKSKGVEGDGANENSPLVQQESSDEPVPQRETTARFAASPPHSPGSTLSRYQAAQLAGRYGRWGEGAPNRPTYGDLEMEKEREKERKRLLWTTDQKVKREIAIMKKCSHDNVVRLIEVIDDPQSKKVFMILEYMEGGEVQWKDDRGFPTLTVDEARRTFRDVVLGLEYLHYQGIIHRDIKPANLLLDKDNKVKISDFGVSHFSYSLLVSSGGLPSYDNDENKQKDPSLADDRELAKTAGSPAFFAPELCLAGEPVTTTTSDQGAENQTHQRTSRPPITKAIDIWALGVTLYCLLFGHVPFTADNEYALFSVITKEDYELPTFMGADRVQIGPRAKRWINLKPWADEEGDVDEEHVRATAEPDIDVNTLSEEAIMVRDLLENLLEKDPTKRVKLEDVKKHPWLTRDIADPPQWLSETDPSHMPSVHVTNEDVETALTGFSKLKQTLKKLQYRLLSGFTGHVYDRENEVHRAMPANEGNTLPPVSARRRRSKSASHASYDVPTIVTNSSRTSPRNTIDNRRTSAANNRSLQLEEMNQSSVALGSGKPHRFFSRRRSVAVDENKDLLTTSKNKQLRSGSSVSQPQSRSHSPTHLEMEEEDGFIKVRTEGRTSKFSPQRRSSRRHDEAILPMSSLAPIVSGEETGVRNTLQTSLLGQEATLRPRKSGADKMRPASRGSLRMLDSVNFFTQANKVGDTSSIVSPERDSNVLQSRTVSGSTLSSIGGPSRPRSRSRLGDVFRNVWAHGGHNHAEGGDSAKYSRFRSRPGTSTSSAAVSPALDKGVMMLQEQQRTASDDNVLHHNRKGTSQMAAYDGKKEDLISASKGLDSETPKIKAVSRMSSSNPPNDQQDHASLNRTPKVIGVDDIDTDLDLSDDDSDEHHRMSSGGEVEDQVWRGTSAGWTVGKMTHQEGASSSDFNEEAKENRRSDSLTPSVEGGYNLFKPPFQGRFVLGENENHIDRGKGMDSIDSAPSEDQYKKRVQKPSHVPGPDVSPGDLTIMSEDRFADAEEASYHHANSNHETQKPDFIQQIKSTNSKAVQNRPSPASAFMRRGGSAISSSQASGSISGADEDEGGVSFQTGRRQGR